VNVVSVDVVWISPAWRCFKVSKHIYLLLTYLLVSTINDCRCPLW